jgi:hypothetical protein
MAGCSPRARHRTVAALITFIFAALPWVLMAMLVGWLLLKIIRRRRSRGV